MHVTSWMRSCCRCYGTVQDCSWLRVPYTSVIRIGWTLWRYMLPWYTVSGGAPFVVLVGRELVFGRQCIIRIGWFH